MAGSAGAVGFPALHRGEERSAAVLLGPEHREAARVELEIVGEALGQAVAGPHAGAAVSGVIHFGHQARCGRDVRVRGGHDAELEGVGAEALAQAQPFGEPGADETPPGRGALRDEPGALGTEAVVGELLEVAGLVAGPAGGHVALGIALVLHDLDQGFEARAASRLLGIDREVDVVAGFDPGRLEHPAGRDVGVVGDGHGVASRERVDAVGLQPVPEIDGRGRVEPARRAVGYAVALEDHVPVEVVPLTDRGRPLVADETREAAGGASIVGLLGRGLDLAPHRGVLPRGSSPIVLPAEAPVPLQDQRARGDQLEADAADVALQPADRMGVALERGIVADADVAKQFGVVGDGGPIEGLRQLDPAKGPALLAEGLDSEGLAPGEAVGVARGRRACPGRWRRRSRPCGRGCRRRRGDGGGSFAAQASRPASAVVADGGPTSSRAKANARIPIFMRRTLAAALPTGAAGWLLGAGGGQEPRSRAGQGEDFEIMDREEGPPDPHPLDAEFGDRGPALPVIGVGG